MSKNIFIKQYDILQLLQSKYSHKESCTFFCKVPNSTYKVIHFNNETDGKWLLQDQEPIHACVDLNTLVMGSTVASILI